MQSVFISSELPASCVCLAVSLGRCTRAGRSAEFRDEELEGSEEDEDEDEAPPRYAFHLVVEYARF